MTHANLTAGCFVGGLAWLLRLYFQVGVVLIPCARVSTFPLIETNYFVNEF